MHNFLFIHVINFRGWSRSVVYVDMYEGNHSIVKTARCQLEYMYSVHRHKSKLFPLLLVVRQFCLINNIVSTLQHHHPQLVLNKCVHSDVNR